MFFGQSFQSKPNAFRVAARRRPFIGTGRTFLSLALGFALLGGLTATITTLCAYAQSAEEEGATQPLDPAYGGLPKVEGQLYGHEYPAQSSRQRVNRVERTLFGLPQKGTAEARMHRIDGKLSEKTTHDHLAEQEPVLSYLETKLFQRTYSELPVAERLTQLETQVFGRSFAEFPQAQRFRKLTYAMPLVARQMRLSQNKTETSIASTRFARVKEPLTEIELAAVPMRPVLSVPQHSELATPSAVAAAPDPDLASSPPPAPVIPVTVAHGPRPAFALEFANGKRTFKHIPLKAFMPEPEFAAKAVPEKPTTMTAQTPLSAPTQAETTASATPQEAPQKAPLPETYAARLATKMANAPTAPEDVFAVSNALRLQNGAQSWSALADMQAFPHTVKRPSLPSVAEPVSSLPHPAAVKSEPVPAPLTVERPSPAKLVTVIKKPMPSQTVQNKAESGTTVETLDLKPKPAPVIARFETPPPAKPAIATQTAILPVTVQKKTESAKPSAPTVETLDLKVKFMPAAELPEVPVQAAIMMPAEKLTPPLIASTGTPIFNKALLIGGPPIPGALPSTREFTEGTYLKRIYRNETGAAIRWETSPVRVFVRGEEDEKALTLQAMQAWQAIQPMIITDKASKADIIISWEPSDVDTHGVFPLIHVLAGIPAGEDSWAGTKAHLLIALFPLHQANTPERRHTLTHTLGHALGLWGHSGDPGDMMFPLTQLELNDFPPAWQVVPARVGMTYLPPHMGANATPLIHISQRDIDTLQHLYQLPPLSLLAAPRE